jgi:hypothetical protein
MVIWGWETAGRTKRNEYCWCQKMKGTQHLWFFINIMHFLHEMHFSLHIQGYYEWPVHFQTWWTYREETLYCSMKASRSSQVYSVSTDCHSTDAITVSDLFSHTV